MTAFGTLKSAAKSLGCFDSWPYVPKIVRACISSICAFTCSEGPALTWRTLVLNLARLPALLRPVVKVLVLTVGRCDTGIGLLLLVVRSIRWSCNMNTTQSP